MSRKSKCAIILTAGFILSRIYLYHLGIRLNTTTLSWFYQFLDPIDLRTNLFQSLYYLHIQPPGFNLFIGLILKLPPHLINTAFSAVYIVSGFLITLSLFLLINELSNSPIIALIFSLFFCISPPVILYENWLFYTYPVALLLLLSTLFLYAYLQNRSGTNLFIFFSIIMLIVITRSLFHIIWFIAIFIFVLSIAKEKSRVIALALFPLLFVSTLYIKNYLIFKEPGLSSWLGMSLIKMTTTIPEKKIIPLIKNGAVSRIALIPPFRSPDLYKDFANFDTCTQIPVLDKKYKSTGFVNFNHIGYLKVSRLYFKSALSLIEKFPRYYLLSVLKAGYHYLRPCSDEVIFRTENRKRIIAWVDIYENFLTGDILEGLWHRTYQNRYGREKVFHFNFLYIFIPFIFIWAFLVVFQRINIPGLNRNKLIVLRYLLFNMLYVTLLSSFIEAGENMRFRFLILPGFYIFLSLLVKYLTGPKPLKHKSSL